MEQKKMPDGMGMSQSEPDIRRQVNKKNKIGRRMSIQFKKALSFRGWDEELKDEKDEKEEPTSIYGQPLEVVVAKFGGPVPPIIKQITRYLRNHIKEEGLFRVSGVSTKINEIGEIFYGDVKRPDLSDIDCHALAGAYKKFFRELPQPIFTTDLFDELLESKSKIHNCENPVLELQQITSKLPFQNFVIIRYVIKFLRKVSKFSSDNKMEPENLGIVFGPTLIRSQVEVETGVPDPLRDPSDIVTLLIRNYKDIFQQNDAPSMSLGVSRDRSMTYSPVSSPEVPVRSVSRNSKRQRRTRTRQIESPRVDKSTKGAIATNPRLSHLLLD